MWKFYILRGIVFSDNILAITLQSKIRNCLFLSGEEMWLQGDDLPEFTLWVGNEVRTLSNLSGYTTKPQQRSHGPLVQFPHQSISRRFYQQRLTEACALGSNFFSQHKFHEINDPKNLSFAPLFCCIASRGMDRPGLQQRASEFLTVVCGGSWCYKHKQACVV